jgi:hypothetical protein
MSRRRHLHQLVWQSRIWYRGVAVHNKRAQTRTLQETRNSLKAICMTVHVLRCTALCTAQHQMLSPTNWKSGLKKKVQNPEKLRDAELSQLMYFSAVCWLPFFPSNTARVCSRYYHYQPRVSLRINVLIFQHKAKPLLSFWLSKDE